MIAALGVCALLVALGFDDGGYTATAWGWSSIVVLAALTLLVARGVGTPGRAALLHVAALAGLTAWTAASIAWSSHFSASVLEVERLLLYVAAAALLVLVGSAPALQAGVLAAVAVLCGFGLADWLFGEPGPVFSGDPEAEVRLSEPIGYANAMGILAAFGLLLSAGFAARATRTSFAGAAAAVAPVLAACLYFTFSRGAWLALALGLAVAVAGGPARLQLAATALALAVPAALAVVAAEALEASAGLAVLLLPLCGIAALVPAGLRAVSAPPPRVRRAFAVALLATPILAAGAAVAKLGGPVDVVEAFKAAPAPTHGEASSRVLDVSGRNRADYWSVAWRSYGDEPALGTGAGSYSRTWLRERPVPQPVTDAHSLYLETLAELGPLGLALLLTALGAPLAARRARWTPLALGPYAAFLAHAGQDWDWELPAVSLAALACGVAPIAGQTTRRLPRPAAVVPAVLCILAALAFVGNRAVQDAIDATDRLAWSDAAEAARRARTLQPWSPEPYRLLGELELAEGSLAVARRHFRRGLEKDPDEFELWIGLGLASDGAAQRSAFERAARLNPLSPELEELGFKTGSAG
jgi:O-antigen ligase